MKDSWKRQHHHGHMEHKDSKNCRETPGTNTRNGQLQMEHLWTLGNEIEVLWKNNNEEGHKVFFSGKEVKHEHGVGFLVHKDIVNTVIGCCQVSSRLITIRLRAVPFNITIVQAYAPTSDYDDNKIDEFYDQLHNVIDQTPKKDILVVQGDLNAKGDRDACGNWQGICGDDTNEKGLRLLEFATINDLVLANTFCHHKASRRWTWHEIYDKWKTMGDFFR